MLLINSRVQFGLFIVLMRRLPRRSIMVMAIYIYLRVSSEAHVFRAYLLSPSSGFTIKMLLENLDLTRHCLPILCISSLVFLLLKKKQLNLPHSPPSDPLIGHARFIPPEYPWKTFAAWRKKFGEFICSFCDT